MRPSRSPATRSGSTSWPTTRRRRALLGWGPVYDLSFEASGGFGLFYYPPTFVPIVLPFGLLTATTAVWAWTALLIGAFLIGVAVMPVSATVRWWIVLLAGLSWPFVYAVKLGQVGPLLFACFAVGWRWLDDPLRLGLSGALGAAIKLQPGLVFVWALLTGRYRAVVAGVVALVALAAVATLLAGVGVVGRLHHARAARQRSDHDRAQLHAGGDRLSAGPERRRRRLHPTAQHGPRAGRGRGGGAAGGV